jgi:hypothetical protein
VGVEQETSKVFFITGAEKEILGATFSTKMTTGKEVGAVFTYIFETNRAFPQLLHLFGSRTTAAN